MSSGAAHCHPIGVGNELHARVDALIEPQVLKFRAQTRQPFRLFRLRAEFAQIEKLAERLVASKPSLLVENVRIGRCAGELQIDARIFAQRRVIDQLTERVHIIGGLRR